MKVSLNPEELPFFSLLVCHAFGVLFFIHFLIFCFMSFFQISGKSKNLPSASLPDLVITFEPSDDGSLVRSVKELNTILDPLCALNYTDFEITNLLKSGVPLKSIMISKDLRLGHDAEIDDFNSHLDEIADKLFNSKD